jgi:hypothetical protein
MSSVIEVPSVQDRQMERRKVARKTYLTLLYAIHGGSRLDEQQRAALLDAMEVTRVTDANLESDLSWLRRRDQIIERRDKTLPAMNRDAQAATDALAAFEKKNAGMLAEHERLKKLAATLNDPWGDLAILRRQVDYEAGILNQRPDLALPAD